jgi:hypothetical protein
MNPDTQTRFDNLFPQYKPHAKTARLVQPVAHGHWLVAFNSLPGVFLVIKGDASPDELAAALAIRHVEAEARGLFAMHSADVQPTTEGWLQ